MSEQLSEKEIIEELWKRGELSYKLRGVQKNIKETLVNDPNTISVVLASRRLGKSFSLLTMAIETCLHEPNSIVKYICPTQKQVKTIIKPAMRIILEDCPHYIKPEWKEADKVYQFPNGSEIQIAGSDNGNAENLRGGFAHLCIVDEAGFCDDLNYIINSILAPTTDTTNGRIFLTSTPNYKNPEHEFNVDFVKPLEAEGRLIKYVIDQSPMLSKKQIQKIVDRYPGGRSNPAFRCEYLCEIPTSTESTVIPEFTDEKQKEIVKTVEKPQYADFYVSADVGFRDLTVALFAYYDYLSGAVVVLDELVLQGTKMTTEHFAQEAKAYEARLFRDGFFNEQQKPLMRVMDNNNLVLINDLIQLHQYNFIATAKDNKEAAINKLRMFIEQNKIIIHPRCKHLIYHIKLARWNKSRNNFQNIKDSPSGIIGAHADALDALIYMVRNVVTSKNPYPKGHFDLKGPDVFSSSGYESSETRRQKDVMHKIMNIKRKS